MRLPQTVGSYRLVERLGAGSFGSVYRAEVLGALGFSQDVAVKILDPNRAIERPDLVASLADEAVLLSRLQHPNIVQVRGLERIEHDFLGTTYAMVMELVRGIPLRRLIDACEEHGVLIPARASLLLVSEAVDALAYAHEMQGPDGENVGFVHRDMKPGNVLVTKEGRLKILDFGIALAADRQVSSTAAGMTKGTVLYMSPEQVRGLPLDGRSDVYSLGLMLFEMLTGELFIPLPDQGLADLAGILAAVAEVTWEDRVPRLREALTAPRPEGQGLSADQAAPLESLLESMLRLQPLERVTAQGLVEVLEELGVDWQLKRGRQTLKDLVRAEYATYDEIPAMRPEDVADVELGTPGPTLDGRRPGGPSRPVDATRILPSSPPAADPAATEPTVGAPPRSRGPSPRMLLGAALLLLAILAVVVWPRGSEPDPGDGLPPLRGPRPTVERGGDLSDGLAFQPPAVADDDDSALADDGDVDVVDDDAEVDTLTEPVDRVARGRKSPSRDRASSPPPAPARVSVEPEAETPAAPVGRASVTLIHDPPRFVVPGAPLSLAVLAETSGDGLMCEPRVILAPRGKRKYRRYPMAHTGDDRFVATIDVPYDEQWAEGVRYFVECCWGGECPVRWRGPSAPQMLGPPEF